jgi:hypothetical protein
LNHLSVKSKFLRKGGYDDAKLDQGDTSMTLEVTRYFVAPQGETRELSARGPSALAGRQIRDLTAKRVCPQGHCSRMVNNGTSRVKKDRHWGHPVVDDSDRTRAF